MAAQTLPNDVLIIIGLTCWRAYKAMFLTNKTVYMALSKYHPRDLFTVERGFIAGWEETAGEYYKHVSIEEGGRYICVYKDGKRYREYNINDLAEYRGSDLHKTLTTIGGIKRFREYDGYRYCEEVTYYRHYALVNRERRRNDYQESHILKIIKDDNGTGYIGNIKYRPKPNSDGYVAPCWMVNMPDGGFFHFNFDNTPNQT